MTFVMKVILIPLVVNVVRLVVNVYTWFTWPFYYVGQEPWKRLKISQSCGSILVGHGKMSNKAPPSLVGAEYLEYERFVKIPQHPLMVCETVEQAIDGMEKIYPLDTPTIGFREILDEEIQYDSFGNTIHVDGKLLRKYKLSDYKWISLGGVLERCRSMARGLLGIGLKTHDPFAIYSETGFDFFTTILGSSQSGALIVTLFHTLNNEGLVHALNETKAKFIFTSFELLDRVASFIDKCPHIKTIIYSEGPKKSKNLEFGNNIKVYTMNEILEEGRSGPYKNHKISSVKPEDLFGVLYTSGTTGIPKGVQLTQAQVKEAAMAIGQVVRSVILTGPKHTYIAYLPQAHVLELSIELFLFLGGVKIGYATPFTLNESAPGLATGQICDLQLLKPTVITVVPLVLDRMFKEINMKLKQRTPFSKGIFDYLISYKADWVGKGYKTPIVNKLLCGKIQHQFGGRLEYMVVGGAPLACQLQKIIKCSLNATLIQGYGTTETSGGVICMDFNDLTFGRIGAPLNGVRVRMVDWSDGDYSINDKPNPRGELVIGGKMISTGYFKLDEQNRESFFDENGYHWFVTGDIAEIHSDGTFRIVDRKKDIVKMANGEFVSLGKVEAILKSSSFVDNVCIFANGIINCLVALVVPNQHSIMELAKQFNDKLSLETICKNKEIIKIIHSDIVKVGSQQKLKSIELPSMITLCHEVWSPDNNLLTAAMKLKRSNISKHYHKDLEQMWLMLKNNPDLVRIKISK